MIRITQPDLDLILRDFLGKPYKPRTSGPDTFDCYGLVRAFMERLGVMLPSIDVDPGQSGPVYERQQTSYIQLDHPRAWSLVTFIPKTELRPHVGIVLSQDNLFLHCPGRAGGRVIAEPLSRKPWCDSIDGFWWPRNILDTVVLLTPMNSRKRAWQLVPIDNRTLRQIIEQDIAEGRQIPVQAFLGGERIDPADWDLIPGATDQLVIRPELGDGRQAAMTAGMVALAVFAPYLAGPIAGTTGAAVAAGTAGAGATLAYSLAYAGIMMGGAMALNALVGPDEADKGGSQAYGWNPATTHNVGAYDPLVYGTFGVRGNVIASFAESEIFTEIGLVKGEYVRSARDRYYLKVAYGDGPIEGVIPDFVELSGRRLSEIDPANITIEHFRGTSNQVASVIPDRFEIPVQTIVPGNHSGPVVKDFYAVECDDVSVVLYFPNGFTNYAKDGSRDPSGVNIDIKIREYGTQDWWTVFNQTIVGNSKVPARLLFSISGIGHNNFYDNHIAPYNIEPGKRYEIKVDRANSTHSDKGDTYRFEAIQIGFFKPQCHPGRAYTAIGAVASEDLNGTVDFYAKIKGKVVRVYDSVAGAWSIRWTDNPAWIAYDLLTRPVIAGDGTVEPYAVEYYRRLNPAFIELNDFVALADWCDELVDDGMGGTEKRSRFNGVIDTDMTVWEAAIKVLKMCQAVPWFNGNKVRVAIDKPATPVQMFNVSNMLQGGFTETWLDTTEAATEYDIEIADENSDYGREIYTVPLRDAERKVVATLDGFGCTSRTQAWRYAARQLLVNKYMKRTVEIPASLDAIYSEPGDVVYVQHPSLHRSAGGRIAMVYANGIQADKPVTMGDGSYALLVRTHDGTAERLSLYAVASVAGPDSDVVTIDGVWEYVPQANDLWIFGQTTHVVDLYRIRGFERTGDGQVLIQAAQYTADYYGDDDATPRIEPRTYSQTRGARSGSLLPTTAEAVALMGEQSGSALDTIIWEGLAFTGDGISTVTWTCSSTGGGGIKYQGLWCPIFDDAIGTQKRWVYFDPAIGDPRYLQATDDINDLAGQSRYVFCENVGGIAYFKGGILMGADQIKLDGIEQGATAGATWGVNIAHQPPHLCQFFYQNDPPSSGMNTGDYWLDTNDGNKLYRYSGSAWVQARDSGIQTALTHAATAQATADGKIQTYFQTTEPASGMAVGDLWFDTDDSNKPYRYSGSAWVAAAYDVADWEKIYGAGKPANYADVTANSFVNALSEHFEDPNGDFITRWTLGSYSAVVSIVPGEGIFGGKVFRTTNRADMTYYRKIPYDPSKMYRIRARVRQTAGAGKLYLGLKSYDAAGEAINLSPYTAQWFCVNAQSVPSTWTEYTGYFTGLTGVVQGVGKPAVSNPGALITGTAYFTIFAHVNYNTAGVTDIDEIAIDILPENADQLAESSTKKWAGETGADVTKNSAIASGLFLDNFDDRDGTALTRWPREYGSATFSVQAGGLAGGKVLRMVAPDGAAIVANYCRHKTWFPYDPSKLYRVRVRARAVVAGRLYMGMAARNTADTGWLSYDGNTSWGGHWFVAINAAVPTDWTVYTGYLKGHAAAGVNGTNAVSPNPDNPAVLRAGTGYIHPFFIAYTVNGRGVETGIEIDEISIDIMPDGGAVGTEAIAPGSVVNYGAAYTDTFAMLNSASGEVDMQSLTITTSGLPVVIQYGATIQYGNGDSPAGLRLYRVGAGDPLQTLAIIKAEAGDHRGYFSAFIHTMPAGTYTYKFTSTGGVNYVLVGKRFLSVTEFKR